MAIAKVFFDSDALMAGSASRKGAAYILLQLSELGLIHGFISQDVVYECRKNLQKKLPEALPTFEQIVSKALTVVESPANLRKASNTRGWPTKKICLSLPPP